MALKANGRRPKLGKDIDKYPCPTCRAKPYETCEPLSEKQEYHPYILHYERIQNMRKDKA